MPARLALPLLVVAAAWIAMAQPAPAEEKERRARWDLAAEQGRITPATRKVRIAVTYGACTGEPRKPRVKRTSVSVIITVPMPAREPLPPGVACPSIAYVKTMTVRLRGRLGKRALRDGSSSPPRLVARPKT